MCGIVGYFGNKNAVPLLLNGLKRLEYRGYDSAGIAIMHEDSFALTKTAGKVKSLESLLKTAPMQGNIGIGHTRWATHGEPSDLNAHPHTDQTGKFVLIHNGIIENYAVLKEWLAQKGVTFQSDTDTEVLVQLISMIYHEEKISFENAVNLALKQVVGTYGILVMCSDEPNQLIAARLGSPLVLGVGEGEYFLASDASPIVEHTRNVIYLEEGECLIIGDDGYEIKHVDHGEKIEKEISRIDFSIEEIEKGNFPHYMLKEIYEQEKTIVDTMRGRLLLDEGSVHLGGIQDYLLRIERARHFYITACGTSWHAGLIGKYILEEFAGIPVHVEYASEFRYRNPVIDSQSVVIAISQSGETADTLAAITKAKEEGALTLGICNVVGSSISRETDCGIYTHAGPEIGVASTKAFTAQVSVLYMLALYLGRKNGYSKADGVKLAHALHDLGGRVKEILNITDEIRKIAEEMVDVENCLYLGRGTNFPVALEGALKLKEISYIHAEGYPAAEMKHGPIALIDEKMPVIFLAPHDKTYEKVLSNIQEVKARKGKIITVTDKNTPELQALSDHVIEISVSHPRTFPILATIPLQLLAYHLAVLRGCDVDMPRNLAKSVTVE
ncbi:MAG: glutamine--fructose-6-phosphate transaminase (isomerizing) [Candidatus Marinimicrobia bacterium]|jgi:glucosamine--fructose-6-phosphate aminotransferase (isomerizing)|uniref:Glutamine--fructose-6-phosphate aminotransferase [isomerizing] n=1 Tax=uncultured bacterium FPPS_57A9 TaxID=1343847 RepID=S4WB46_9BACT|nr:aminotransferase [isomerizing] [uncultured bacterium FPPS_57A9]MBT3732705.1 glutamine--fructose-6-phosphate transaminase (isomerizing) [Candidatus Neomarinimicrobiota bacterium]MBT4178030.1 glutamine--fructose-6-phosphate transaminase (isomerizing) [Candidatus Neomarinimicrobiota bacterium]MBT5355222.1 glutamine--fructose-6-phosphate transaminase (isomerizing) [Candidatus Neomarinimicrobiota bacterium]MBT7358324.1 glutamine--fructose-6-phosphate transaminase (isomerizing) [Candidatus Neomari